MSVFYDVVCVLSAADQVLSMCHRNHLLPRLVLPGSSKLQDQILIHFHPQKAKRLKIKVLKLLNVGLHELQQQRYTYGLECTNLIYLASRNGII